MSEDDPELAAIRRRLMADMMKETAPVADAEEAPAGPAWPDAPVNVGDADFAAAVERYPLALVDFWAPWCGPCRYVAPVVDELAREMRGQVAFLKVNTDESPRTAQAYGIQSIPTLLVFRDGRPVDGAVGALPKPRLEQMLRRHVERRGTPGPRRMPPR